MIVIISRWLAHGFQPSLRAAVMSDRPVVARSTFLLLYRYPPRKARRSHPESERPLLLCHTDTIFVRRNRRQSAKDGGVRFGLMNQIEF